MMMTLLQMSISGAIMIFAVLVIRALAINRLPKKTFIALWGIVLLRLLVPFSFSSPFSAYSLVSRHIFTPQQAVGLENTSIISTPNMPTPTADDVFLQGQSPTSISPFVVVWGIGLILCALFFAVSYFKCRKEFRESLPIKNDFLTHWIAQHKLSRRIEIRQSSHISAPLTYGVFKAIILMPKNTKWNDTKQIEYILAHEFVHIRHFDAATKLLLTAVLCIHWFNPLVWIMYILFNRDIELSCDETVVRIFGETTKATYARTLISMEEKKSTLTPLCNNFSKNAIEERITAIMKLKKISIATILVAFGLIIGITTVFATSPEMPSPNSLQASYDKTFGEYERQRLNAFKFDRYENMSVASYQQKAWGLLDTSDYREVIDRISQNNMLYKMRYNNNQDASFLFNILKPLSAEKWQTQDFRGYTQAPNDAVQGNQAILEYQLFLTILDANSLTVGQYDKARQSMEEGLHNLLQSKTNVELQDENTLDRAIRTEIATLKTKWETPTLQIAVEYSVIPLSVYESPSINISNGYEQEKRPYPNATEADYQSLLALKTADYKNQSVAYFNETLLAWATEHEEMHGRIMSEVVANDFSVKLTDEELTFITLTFPVSNAQNTIKVLYENNGVSKTNPIMQYRYVTDEPNVEYTLWYQLSIQIPDENKLTIGERDRLLYNVINGMQTFWNDKDFDALSSAKEEIFKEKLTTLVNQNSNSLVKLEIYNLSFQGLDERDLANN